MQPAQISATGLDIEWQRIQVIAQNIANINTTRTPQGGPYQPMSLVSGPRASFNTILENQISSRLGVEVAGVLPQNASPKLVFEPNHPHANGDGFVAYPAIDHVLEMSSLVKALRVYEANVVALNASRGMNAKALEIGSR
jgi:flagellar basal-body rod protein FlgC